MSQEQDTEKKVFWAEGTNSFSRGLWEITAREGTAQRKFNIIPSLVNPRPHGCQQDCLAMPHPCYFQCAGLSRASAGMAGNHTPQL